MQDLGTITNASTNSIVHSYATVLGLQSGSSAPSPLAFNGTVLCAQVQPLYPPPLVGGDEEEEEEDRVAL